MDPFVRIALKRKDYNLYASLKGRSKKPLSSMELEKAFLENLSIDTDRVDLPLFTDEKLFKAFSRALERTAEFFKVEPFEPLAPEECAVYNMNTSAGYSYYPLQKKDVQDQIVGDVKRKINIICSGKEIVVAPCMLASRGKLSFLWNRMGRIIYMYDWQENVIQGMFFRPMNEQMKYKDDSIMVFGNNIIPKILSVVSRTYEPRIYCVRTDFSKFDVRTQKVVNKIICKYVVEPNIKFDTWRGKRHSPAATKRWYRLWTYAQEYFMNTPVMVPSGFVYKQKGKVSSGGDATSLFDSMYNALMILTMVEYYEIYLQTIKVLGDDGFSAVLGKPDIEEWARFFDWAFGARLSVDKTEVFPGGAPVKSFLGYKFEAGFLKLSDEELFLKALYPEGDVDTVEKSLSRLTAFMFLGGYNSIRFTNFVQYFSSGWDINYNAYIELDRKMQKKMWHLGLQFELKKLKEYTMFDFLWGMFKFKSYQ